MRTPAVKFQIVLDPSVEPLTAAPSPGQTGQLGTADTGLPTGEAKAESMGRASTAVVAVRVVWSRFIMKWDWLVFE